MQYDRRGQVLAMTGNERDAIDDGVQGKGHRGQHGHGEVGRSCSNVQDTLHDRRERDPGCQESYREQAACLDRLGNNMHTNNPGHGDDDECIQAMPDCTISPTEGIDERPQQERECAEQKIHVKNSLMIRSGLALLILLLAIPSAALAHGGVVEEDDICVIKVNYLRAHFKIYQPRVSGHEQFCEDLPVAAESLFVMEYMHDALQTMPIDFRIIRDVTGKGRFAQMEHVAAIEDLDAVTVFHRDATQEQDVYMVTHTFAEEGDFIGIVSAQHPETGVVYAAVFPFEVGFTGWGYWPVLIALLVLVQVHYLVMSGRLRRWFGKSAPALLLLGVAALHLPQAAQASEFVVTYSTPDGPPEINQMHSWVLHVETDQGVPVEGAEIEVDGGMPAHDHGLPTKPRVTEELGGGDYRLDGVRFHMSGYWEMVITIRSDDSEETVVVSLTL